MNPHWFNTIVMAFGAVLASACVGISHGYSLPAAIVCTFMAGFNFAKARAHAPEENTVGQ
jgi:hydrogenase/urease accessory protein HupE